jgi:Zn-finger nucleic acid-binding protein
MDVFVLLDRLDDMLYDAKAVPFTGQVRLDRAELEDIIDQLRATIPEEFKAARAIVARDRENATDD